MNKLEQIYKILLKEYGPQGWWPIVNDKTLICEYHTGAPKNDAERLEIAISCVLTQNTQWYPNTVRAIQQLKLDRPFTEKELEELKKTEIIYQEYLKKPQKITKKDILTQNTSWANVEKAIINLNKVEALSIEKIREMPKEKLGQLIRPAGYYNQKSERLKIVAEFFSKNKNPTREQLLKVNGIGPETADSILLYAYAKPVFVIDAYTKRIMSRIGICKENISYDGLQEIFHKNLKSEYKLFNEYHALLVEHAKRHCKKKPECPSCPIKKYCAYNRTQSFKY